MMAHIVENKTVVDSLPCSFKQPMLLFRIATICMFVGLGLSIFSFIYSYLNVMGFADGNLASGYISTITGYTLILIASALIVVLLYQFARASKVLKNEVNTDAYILMYLYLASLIMTILSMPILIPEISILAGWTLIPVTIVTVIYFYILGKGLKKNYDGLICKIGRNLHRIFYFIIISIAVVLFVLFTQIPSFIEIPPSRAEVLGGIILLLTGGILWVILIFFFLYFGVYYNMAKILQNGAN